MIRLPTDSEHHSIIGANGTGKTQAAQWHLANRNFHVMPWLIYDFKGDESIGKIPGAVHIGVDEVPEAPGIYVTHPLPNQRHEVERQMWSVWERGNTGIYIDEGYMIGPDNEAFRAILTQGRSKKIPLIVLSQRPVYMDRFVLSESNVYQVFRLNHKKDRETVQGFIPRDRIDLEQRLPRYHSVWYDVVEDRAARLAPVPDIKVIHGIFARRLRRFKNDGSGGQIERVESK